MDTATLSSKILNFYLITIFSFKSLRRKLLRRVHLEVLSEIKAFSMDLMAENLWIEGNKLHTKHGIEWELYKKKK